MKTRTMSFIAIYVAMFAAFEYLGKVLGLLQMPSGGSISISEIPLVIGIYHLGVKRGSLLLLINFFIMFLMKPPYFIHWFQFMLDYIFAYASYLLVGLLSQRKFNVVTFSLTLFGASFLRFVIHDISGLLYFADGYDGNVLLGISIYNLSYLLPTTIVLIVISAFLVPRLRNYWD